MNFAITIALALHLTQTPQIHLSDFLATQPPTISPLLVVDPENTPKTGDSNTLAAFNRKLVRLGTISAIVPTEMTVVNDEFPEPDIYEGADNNSKVLFLLATMTDAQYRIATTTGVSEADLSGQTRAALHSLLKDPIQFADRDSPEKDPVTVPESQKGQVRLRLYRTEMFLGKSGPNSGLMTENPHYTQYPGKSPLHRVGAKHNDAAEFRFQPTSVQPNRQKPSALSFTSGELDQPVSLPHNSIIGDLISQIGGKVGKPIFADPRVATLSIQTKGGSAKAGDLLKAIALAVTGTYRQVGKSFVLTSDQIGIGARQLRFWTWQTDSLDKLKLLRKGWMKSILDQGRNVSLPFLPNDPFRELASTPEEKGDKFFPSDQLKGATRQGFLDLAKDFDPRHDMQTMNVMLIASPTYAIVLPNGRQLEVDDRQIYPFRWWSIDMGDSSPYMPPGRLGIGGGKIQEGIALHIESPSAAALACQAAKNAGFSEIWLETSNRQTLEAAKACGTPVRLVLEPWRLAKPVPDMDRDPLGGTHGKMSLSPEAENEGRPFLSPFSIERQGAWDAQKELASDPSLAGLVVVDTAPPGYEAGQMGSPDPGPRDRPSFPLGYSAASRESFLNANGCDPIDLVFDIPLLFEIGQPFFPVENSRNEPTPLQLLHKKWNEFRSGMNEQLTTRYLEGLQTVSPNILVQLRKPFKSLGIAFDEAKVIPWTTADGLSNLYAPHYGETKDLLDYKFADRTPKLDEPILDLSTQTNKSDLILDLRPVPEKDLPSVIATWFVSMAK